MFVTVANFIYLEFYLIYYHYYMHIILSGCEPRYCWIIELSVKEVNSQTTNSVMFSIFNNISFKIIFYFLKIWSNIGYIKEYFSLSNLIKYRLCKPWMMDKNFKIKILIII